MDNNNILIIEDDLLFSNQVNDLFIKSGFNTKQTDNIDDALLIMTDFKPAGIYLDIQLNGPLGINLLKIILTENNYIDYVPFIIVVSSLITKQVSSILQQHQLPYYDKASSKFKIDHVVDSFTFLTKEPQRSNPFSHLADASMQNNMSDDALKNQIHQRLSVFDFEINIAAYSHLVEAIFYYIRPPKNIDLSTKNALSSIFIEVMDIDYHAGFTSVKRLIEKAFRKNSDVFLNVFPNIEKAPTVSDFIKHIVTDLRNDEFF